MQNMSSSSMEDIEEQTSESVPANETDKAKLTRLLIINESDECTEYDICDSRSLNDEAGMVVIIFLKSMLWVYIHHIII